MVLVAVLAASLVGCTNGSATGVAFVDQGESRESFIAQKGEDAGAPDLPNAVPIESSELSKMLNEAQTQKEQNEAKGNAVANDVNGFSSSVLDTNGMTASLPDDGALTVPDDWQHPVIIEEGKGPTMKDIDEDLSQSANISEDEAQKEDSNQ